MSIMASTFSMIRRRLSAYTHRRSAINAAAELKTKVGKNLELAAVFVPLGIVLSTGVMLGVHTEMGQLSRSPSVRVNKKLRGTIPEVDDPDSVAEEGSRYVNRSIFRKVAHIRDFDAVRSGVSAPTRPNNAHSMPRHVESLKSVGVDP